MGYTSSYKDVVYPGPDREPRVLKYRIALLDESPLTPHAIIHLVQSNPKDPPPDHLEAALDVLLNRIVANEFIGVRVDHLHFVLETDAAFFEYTADDFQKRGNLVIVKGTGKKRTLHIESRDVVGGPVHLVTQPGKRHGFDEVLAGILS